MIENTTKGIWMSLNTSVAITTGEDAQDDGKVFGMRQFRDNNAENLTDDEYLETLLGPKAVGSNALLIPLTILYVVIFISGVAGNFAVCLVIVKNKSMHTATNYYLFSLAISDLMILFFGLPFELTHYWQQYPWVFGESLCRGRSMVSEMISYASVLTIVSFSMERYLAICHPLYSHTMSGFKRAMRIIGMVWLIAMIAALPYAFFTQIHYIDRPLNSGNLLLSSAFCAMLPDNIYPKGYPVYELSSFIFFIFPMGILMILYIRMGLSIKQTSGIQRNLPARSVSVAMNGPPPSFEQGTKMYDELPMEEYSANSRRFFSRRKRKASEMKGDISCCHTKCQSILQKHFTKPITGWEINEALKRDAGRNRFDWLRTNLSRYCCGCSTEKKGADKSFLKNDASDNGTLRTHHAVKSQDVSGSSMNSENKCVKAKTANDKQSNGENEETILPAPTPSPRIHRLKPTSIRKQRTLQDEHFHERKPLMSRTNYLDDSNITLSSFRSSSTNNLKETVDFSISNKTFSSLSRAKKKKKAKPNKDCNISSQDVDVRAITKFYMSNTSQKLKDSGRHLKDKQKEGNVVSEKSTIIENDTTGNMSGQELCPNGNANELCGNTDIPKCISSSSHQKDRKQSISMIDLTNNVNDISYVRAGHHEETKVCCQTKSVEDISFRGKKMTQNALENDYLKERLLNNSAQNSCKDKQKELQELCTSCAFYYTQYCNQIHQMTQHQQQPQRPDDTDSFTPRVRSDKRSITLLLAAVVLAFFLCWLPFHAQRLAYIYFSDSRFYRMINEYLFYISGVLYYFSATVNPILYNLMSLKYRHAFYQTLFGRNGCFCCKRNSHNHQRRDSMWNWWTGHGQGYVPSNNTSRHGKKTTKQTYRFRGTDRSSTIDGAELSSTGMSNTESTIISRRYGTNRLSYKGYQNQRCQFSSPSSKHSSQFDSDTCCDPVLAANMAALAFNLNTTNKYRFKRPSKKNLRPVQHKSEFHAALESIERNACSDIVEEDSGMTNHSSSINVVCNAAKLLVSPSNLSQHLNVKRLQESTSFELLPITPPPMIPEESNEKQEYEYSPEKKSASSQTIEDTLLGENQIDEEEGLKKETSDNISPSLCRCPNCKCANCIQDDQDSETDDDNISRGGFEISDDDEDSGTESYTNEEARRRLSVSSFAKSSASVLIHSCLGSKSPE